MALDCYTIKMLALELDGKLKGGRIDKIYQMSKVQLLMTVRSLGENHRLYISCDASKGRVCITNQKFENPDVPPVFCMLMRKHFAGGKIKEITAKENERIIIIRTENTNELFEPVEKNLIIELMGKYSNIILTDGDNRIIDCVFHVDFTVSEKRQILPGLYYETAPVADKINPYMSDSNIFIDILKNSSDFEKTLIDNFSGMSPILAREIVYRGKGDYINCAMEYSKILKLLEDKDIKPTALLEKRTKKPKELYIFDIMQYEDYYEKKYFLSVNECVDYFYGQDEKLRRITEKKAELKAVVSKHIKKVSKKLDIHLKNIEKAKSKDKYRIYAELITANLYKLKENSKEVLLENYYDDNNLLKIPMDETISPARNSKKYFEKYNKEKNMEKVSSQMAVELKDELLYLNEVMDMIDIADDLKSLSEIRDELVFGDYIELKKNEIKKKKDAVSQPNKFISSEGYTILSGKNNRQNEILTLKTASKNDLWFHARNVAGSHTVIRCEGEEVNEKTIEEAAIIAAYYSKKSEDTKVDVDYTLVKYVKKPQGAKPGMVIYDNFKSITVVPDKELIEKMKED